MEFKSFRDYTILQLTELWNEGFQQFSSNMTRTPFQFMIRIGKWYTHPDLSVVVCKDDKPVAFVVIGWQEIHGKKWAWNGGTGIIPAYRGQGMSQPMMREAIRRVREAGADHFSLEVRTHNEPAMRAYLRTGFEIQDTFRVFVKSTDFSKVTCQIHHRTDLKSYRTMGEACSRLSFYNANRTSWTTQWFNLERSQSVFVYDAKQEIIGYALFMEDYHADGKLNQITLYHCEAKPEEQNKREVLQYLLHEVFQPQFKDIKRTAQYVRVSNTELIDLLEQAEFQSKLEEYFMVYPFQKRGQIKDRGPIR